LADLASDGVIDINEEPPLLEVVVFNNVDRRVQGGDRPLMRLGFGCRLLGGLGQ
jgi:hypothetical protein